MNTQQALSILKHNGLYGLYAPDGCLCAHVSFHGVTIDVSCHKSAHTLRVFGQQIDPDPKGLEEVAKLVLEQMDTIQGSKGYSAGYTVLFREAVFDNKCCWCHAPKAYEQEYLCQKCRKSRAEADAAYPWMLDGFMKAGFSKGPVEFEDMTGKPDPGYINFLNFPKEGNPYQYRSPNIDGYFVDDAKIDFNPRTKAIPDWVAPSPGNWRSSKLDWLGAPDPAAAYKGPASMVMATGTYSSLTHLIRTPQNNKCAHVYPPVNQGDSHTTFLKPKGPKGDMTIKCEAQLCVKCGNVKDGVWVTVSWERKA